LLRFILRQLAQGQSEGSNDHRIELAAGTGL
jgi:hypothetical protein